MLLRLCISATCLFQLLNFIRNTMRNFSKCLLRCLNWIFSSYAKFLPPIHHEIFFQLIDGVNCNSQDQDYYQCSICRGLGDLTTSLVPLNLQVFIGFTGLVKNTLKYIADPLWFYHKLSTDMTNNSTVFELESWVRQWRDQPRWQPHYFSVVLA